MSTDAPRFLNPDRRLYLTASEVPILLGLSPFGWTPQDVLDWKRAGTDTPLPDDASALSQQLGLKLENLLLDWAELQVGPLVRQQFIARPDLHLSATPDGLTEAGEPVECKVSGLTGDVLGDWSLRPPAWVIAQVTAQMIVSGARRGYVVALVAGRGRLWFTVQREPALVERIVHTAAQFHELLTSGQDWPESTTTPQPEAPVALHEPLVTQYIALKEKKEALEQSLQTLKDKIVEKMGTATTAVDSLGARVKLVQISRPYFDSKSFSKVHPELYKDFVRTTVYTTFRTYQAREEEQSNE